jgi:hypothetical protein
LELVNGTARPSLPAPKYSAKTNANCRTHR